MLWRPWTWEEALIHTSKFTSCPTNPKRVKLKSSETRCSPSSTNSSFSRCSSILYRIRAGDVFCSPVLEGAIVNLYFHCSIQHIYKEKHQPTKCFASQILNDTIWYNKQTKKTLKQDKDKTGATIESAKTRIFQRSGLFNMGTKIWSSHSECWSSSRL